MLVAFPDYPAPPSPAGPDETVVLVDGRVTGFQAAENQTIRPSTRFLYSGKLFFDAFEDAETQDLQRTMLGFEFANWRRNASFQFQVPFTSGLAGGSDNRSSSIALGDIALVGKWLLFDSPGAFVSAGVAMEVPTAGDASSSSPFATASVEGDAWTFSPFIGGELSISPRLYVQGIVQTSHSTSRDQVTLLDASGASATTAFSRDALRVSGTIGRAPGAGCCDPFVSQLSGGLISRVSPKAELHYTYFFDDGFSVGLDGATAGYSNGDTLNLVFASDVGIKNLTFSPAIVLPVAGGNRGLFDWELVLQLSVAL